MNNSDLLFYQSCEKQIELSHQCKIENGIEDDEKFTIVDIIGDFERVEIKNQYNQKFTINPNQILDI